MIHSAAETLEHVTGILGDFAADSYDANGEAVVMIPADKWAPAAKKLHESGFSLLSDLCGVDYLDRDPRFEVVCELLTVDLEGNNDEPHRIRVKIGVPDGSPPTLASVTDVWPTADWHERETFDMFGIAFEGHPDLRRILMPDEWEGHPLRKDYAIGKVPVEYKHLSPGYTPGIQR